MQKRLARASKMALLCGMDCVFLMAAYAGSLWLYTYMLKMSGGFFQPYLRSLPYMAGGCAAFYLAFGIYSDMWVHISATDLLRLAVAAACAAFFGYVALRQQLGGWPSPIIGVTAFYLFATASGGVRLLPSVMEAAKKYVVWKGWRGDSRIPMLVVGAGEAGAALLKDMQSHGRDGKYRVVALVDDDAKKLGQKLRGVAVLGQTRDVPALCKRLGIGQIVIAVPSATTDERRAILSHCAAAGCKVRSMPPLSKFSDASVASLHDLDIADLLGRREVVLDPAVMATYLTDRVVLVTGGGGSIGSELCRQILRFNPKRLVIFDFYENNADNLMQELRVTNPAQFDRLTARIGSVQHPQRLREVFGEVKPEVVFHAAAYKHVHLMEQCPELAIANNVFGTYNAAVASIEAGVRRFVMISTDKAVNPTNVMGASKRLAELVIQSMNGRGTEFVAVRFGNVLGSNGSVVPIFQRQIEAGGPVLVTHPDIIRYYMTIPEAARLVLLAGARAVGGETFVLDMGDPVKTVDLARTMIELAGLVPDVDIPIKFTGLRPGEKLYEELLLSAEGAQKTLDDKIYVAHSTVLSPNEREAMLETLQKCIETEDDMKKCIKDVLPTYTPDNGDGVTGVTLGPEAPDPAVRG